MKLKKVFMAIIGTIIGCTIAAVNVLALDTFNSRNISKEFAKSALSADSIVNLGKAIIYSKC